VRSHAGAANDAGGVPRIVELPPKHPLIPIRPEELQGAHRSSIPSKIEPMLATLSDRPFSDPNWLFEIKWDGVRAMARIENGDLTLLSRTGADMTKRYPELSSLPMHCCP